MVFICYKAPVRAVESVIYLPCFFISLLKMLRLRRIRSKLSNPENNLVRMIPVCFTVIPLRCDNILLTGHTAYIESSSREQQFL